MKKITLKLMAIAGLYTLSWSAFANTPPQPSLDVQAWIEHEMRVYHIPGASIALIDNYQIEWARGFGVKNKERRERVTGNTLFQAASVSQPIIAIATIKAFDQKELSLDTEMSTILKTWKLPKNDDIAERPVTMRLLLSLLPHSVGTIGVQQALTGIYSQPFDQVMDRLILSPLGMKRSIFTQSLPSRYSRDVALPYLPNGYLIHPTKASDDDLWTTPTDLAKFVIAIQEALRGHAQAGITQQMVEEMMKPGLESHMGTGLEVNLNRYGKHLKKDDDYFMQSGFNSGYLAIILASKKQGNGIVIMVNAAPDKSGKKAPQYNFLTHVVKRIAKLENWK